MLVFNDSNELLVVQNKENTWELPGGGWEHSESLDECVQRELSEEANVELERVQGVKFVFTGTSDHGWRVMRIVVAASVRNLDVRPGDDMIAAKFMSKDEFLEAQFHATDAAVQQYVDQIWPIS